MSSFQVTDETYERIKGHADAVEIQEFMLVLHGAVFYRKSWMDQKLAAEANANPPESP